MRRSILHVSSRADIAGKRKIAGTTYGYIETEEDFRAGFAAAVIIRALITLNASERTDINIIYGQKVPSRANSIVNSIIIRLNDDASSCSTISVPSSIIHIMLVAAIQKS